MRAVRLAAAALLAVCLSACSTVMVDGDYPHYATAPEMFDRATAVVQARIGAGEVRDVVISRETGETSVYTVYTVAVEQAYKGAAAGDTLEIKQAGGRSGLVTYVDVDVVPLIEGEMYVLFLETYADTPASPLNPTQAIYRVDATGQLTPVDPSAPALTHADLARLAATR